MRLIDANEVVKSIVAERDKIPRTVPSASYELVAEKPFHHGNSMRGGIRKALRCIEQAPTVDAVPVVRCEKCLYWQSGENECEKWEYCTLHNIGIGPHSFCSYGEREEGADNEP